MWTEGGCPVEEGRGRSMCPDLEAGGLGCWGHEAGQQGQGQLGAPHSPDQQGEFSGPHWFRESSSPFLEPAHLQGQGTVCPSREVVTEWATGGHHAGPHSPPQSRRQLLGPWACAGSWTLTRQSLLSLPPGPRCRGALCAALAPPSVPSWPSPSHTCPALLRLSSRPNQDTLLS